MRGEVRRGKKVPPCPIGSYGARSKTVTINNDRKSSIIKWYITFARTGANDRMVALSTLDMTVECTVHKRFSFVVFVTFCWKVPVCDWFVFGRFEKWINLLIADRFFQLDSKMPMVRLCARLRCHSNKWHFMKRTMKTHHEIHFTLEWRHEAPQAWAGSGQFLKHFSYLLKYNYVLYIFPNS
jgi:hypothetical protein